MQTAKEALLSYKRIDRFPVHPSYRGVRNFLKTLDVRDQFDGVTFFGRVNCNYILFPSGFLVANYGFNGQALMSRLRHEGISVVEAELRQAKKDIKALLKG